MSTPARTMPGMNDVLAGVTALSPKLWLVALAIVLVVRLVAARQLIPLLAIFLPEKLARRAERVLRIQHGRLDAQHGSEATDEPEAGPERPQGNA